MSAAATFSKFDQNEDNRLEVADFQALCATAQFELTEDEIQSAVRMLDTRGSGFIEFDEFAVWWVAPIGVGASDPYQVASG